MRKWIEDLLALQNVDLRVRGLKTKLATIPSERLRLEKDYERAKSGVKAAKESLAAAERRVKELEGSVAQGNADIIKLQAQSTMVKKNDEYQAMLKQVDEGKRRISDLETAEIEALDKVEAAQASVKTAEKAFADSERSIRSELQEFVQLEKDIKTEMAALQASRKSFEDKVEQANLSVYNRLVATNKGLPLAKVKDGTHCSNCQLRLTPQTLGQAKGGLLALCDNCSHIVYVETADDAS